MPITSTYSASVSPLFRVLTTSQIEEIVLAAQEVLERTGVTVHDEEARDILAKAGCWVEGILVRIPSAVVRRALQSVPNSVTFCNSRTGSRDVLLEGYNAYFGTGSDTPFTIDPYSGERTCSTTESVERACKVIDALPNLDFVMSLGIVQDIAALVFDRHQFEAQILNTSKPIVTTAHDIHGFADIEYGSTSSLEFLTINNDVIGMARRLMCGIGVSNETLALDVIDSVGPGGDLLSEPHTLKHFKTETHFPDLIDSQRYEAWQAAGSKTLFERANEKVRSIIETYEVDPLPQDVVQGVREVVERAHEALA
ncbi:MAG: trimethylamine methyltransferase family protein [Actinobacteria bacterium]|nr:trimethylamine methyltransferase family protein [Actinomycetota bacterium]